jgi:hypothetical protein
LTRNQKLVLGGLLIAVVALVIVMVGAAAAASGPTPQTGTPGAQMVAANHAAEVKQLEGSIKKNVETAIPGTTILDVTCIPDGTGNEHSTSYACLAATTKNSDGSESGYNFTGVINWDTGQYVWRLAR